LSSRIFLATLTSFILITCPSHSNPRGTPPFRRRLSAGWGGLRASIKSRAIPAIACYWYGLSSRIGLDGVARRSVSHNDRAGGWALYVK
jgi:hypothetical protein